MANLPETHYARSGEVHIAYQVVGDGPRDIVYVPGFISHLDLMWESPRTARVWRRLSSFARLILFDKRGTGLSDRMGAMPTLEERMDDVRAVMDAVGSKQAGLVGHSEGGPLSILFAATYPQRTSALVLCGAYARRQWAPDCPWGRTEEQLEGFLKLVEEKWGQGDALARSFDPNRGISAEYKRFLGRLERTAASPGATLSLLRMNAEIDVRHLLPSVTVPTLVLHRVGDPMVTVENGRELASRIRGAKYGELAGNDHVIGEGDADALLDEIEIFLTGVRRGPEPDRVLATVLFTDIVDATKRLAEIGDHAWKEILAQHHFVVRKQLDRYRGREIDTAGDGFLAAFDGPARAVRCAQAISDGVKPLGISVRAGVHTGECEIMGEKLGGIAVHIGSRIASLATGGEVLVSTTVKDLVAGAGIRFEPRGSHTLKGIPGEWTLLAAS
jgi:pimeloyl-ACP methyl ester carboxylesterase